MRKKKLPEKLRICMIASRFPILGRAAMYGFLWPIAKGLAAAGHSVTVLSLKSPLSQHKIERDNVTAFFLYEGSHEFLHLSPKDAIHKKFLELHRTEPFDIIHSIDDLGLQIGREKRKHNVAIAYDVQATRMSQIFSLMALSQETLMGILSAALRMTILFLRTYYGGDRKLLSTADGVFVTSPQQRLVLERYYLYPESSTHMVPYGIELSDVPRDPAGVAKIRERFGIAADSPVALCISDFTEMREIKSLLEAFQSVAIKKPKARLVLVGEGPLLHKAEYEILSLALGKFVILAGVAKNVEIPDYIALSNVLISLSSRTSGFEPSLLEAMAQQKIIVGSEVSPISTIVEDGIQGYLIRPADVQSLKLLLLEIFEGRTDTTTIGKRAATVVKGLFESHTLTKKTLDAYHSVMVDSGLYAAPQGRSRWVSWLIEFDA